MTKYFIKIIKNIYFIKQILKQLEKFIVFNYLSRNIVRVKKVLSDYLFLFIILFSMISLSLYLETPIENFEDIEISKNTEMTEDTNFFNKDSDIDNKNLVSWGEFDPTKNKNLSDVESAGSYEQKTNNIRPEIENYELDWWKWPKSDFSPNKPCRAGTKICNKIEPSDFIPMNEASYTTAIAYKTDAALKKKKAAADKFAKDKKAAEKEKKRKKKLLYNK